MNLKKLIAIAGLSVMTATAGFASTEGVDSTDALIVLPEPIVTYTFVAEPYVNYSYTIEYITYTPIEFTIPVEPVVIDGETPTNVPLPAGGLLLLGSLAAFAGLRRRK